MLFATEVDLTPAWFSLILQGGSFAVLVYFIIYGGPKLRREIAIERKDEIEAYVSDIKEQRKDFTESLTATQTTFKVEAQAERMACEKHFETLATAMSKGNEATIQAVATMAKQIQSHSERNQQWSELLKAETAKLTALQSERHGDGGR